VVGSHSTGLRPWLHNSPPLRGSKKGRVAGKRGEREHSTFCPPPRQAPRPFPRLRNLPAGRQDRPWHTTVDEVFPQKAPTGRLHCSPGRQPAAGRPALGGRRSRTPSFFFSPEPRKGRLNLNRPDGAQSKKGKWWLGRIPRACARGYITVRPSGAQKKGGWQEKGGKGNILLFAPRRDRPATAFPSPAEPACRPAASPRGEQVRPWHTTVDEVFPQKAPTGRLHCSPGRQPAAGRPALGGRRSRTPSFFFSPEPRKGRLNLNRPDGAQSKKGKWWLGRIPRACARGYITVRPSGAQKKGGWQEKGGKGNILLFAPRRDRRQGLSLACGTCLPVGKTGRGTQQWTKCFRKKPRRGACTVAQGASRPQAGQPWVGGDREPPLFSFPLSPARGD